MLRFLCNFTSESIENMAQTEVSDTDLGQRWSTPTQNRESLELFSVGPPQKELSENAIFTDSECTVYSSAASVMTASACSVMTASNYSAMGASESTVTIGSGSESTYGSRASTLTTSTERSQRSPVAAYDTQLVMGDGETSKAGGSSEAASSRLHKQQVGRHLELVKPHQMLASSNLLTRNLVLSTLARCDYPRLRAVFGR